MNEPCTLKHSSELAVAEGETISCPPPMPSGAGRAELSTAQPSFILCPYDFIKLMSGNNHSFNYSLLLINYLKINIMLLFLLLPFFFHYLSNLLCSLILGFFHDTLMAPAAQRSLSQCHLSLTFPSISPTHLSELRVCSWGRNPPNLPTPALSFLGANLVLVQLIPYTVTSWTAIGSGPSN